jgi:hypothetical protein
MKRIERTVLIGMMLGAWIITAPEAATGAAPAARAPRDPVDFSRPEFVDPPKVLLGDAAGGRCPDPTPAVS